MQVKTILNRVQKFKSFVYKQVRWLGSVEAPELEIDVAERTNSRPRGAGMIDSQDDVLSLFRCGASRITVTVY